MTVGSLEKVAGAYYLNNDDFDCIVGPVGSGKSTASCLRLQRHAYEQRPQSDGVARSRFAIVRNTRPQLRDTTQKTWFQLFPEKDYGEFLKSDAMHRWRFRPDGYDYEIDAEFMFTPLDDEKDVNKLLSLDLTGIYFNEIREIDQSIISHALRRVGRYPAVNEGGCRWAGVIGDTNPWDTDHFLHDWFVRNPRPGYTLFRQPGGLSPDAENLHNLPKDYYTKGLRDFSKEDAQVYIHAEWGRTRAGKPIYSEYVDSTHCKPFELDPRFPLEIGLDFGRTPAAVIAQQTPFGGWKVRKELWTDDMGAVKFARELRKMLNAEFPGFPVGRITGDPAGNQRDAHDATVFELMKPEGIVAKPAFTNDFSVRVEAVQTALQRMAGGEPALIIHPDCKRLRDACIDGYRYRKLQMSGNRYSDDPDKNEYSHVAEALQYLLLGGGEGKKVLGRGRAGLMRPAYSLT